MLQVTRGALSSTYRCLNMCMNHGPASSKKYYFISEHLDDTRSKEPAKCQQHTSGGFKENSKEKSVYAIQ